MPPLFAPMAVPQAAPCPTPPQVLVLVLSDPLKYLAPISPQLAPMAVALEEFWYLALLSPLLAPMAVAQGLVPALSDPWCPYVVVLVLVPPQSAPTTVPQAAPSPKPTQVVVLALLDPLKYLALQSPQLAPMAVGLVEFCYPPAVRLTLISPLLAPMAVAQGLVPMVLLPPRYAPMAVMSPLLAPMVVAPAEF